ncbi:MAG: histidinol-phosphate transaminase [Varibaculum sp.]|nr:histidinol-phosphate transaminase [Varibaculum sp.]
MRLPLRPDLEPVEAYGAPQLDVSVRLNVNENPYQPSAGLIADITGAVAEAVRGANRYPDRDFTKLSAALAHYLERESGVRPPAVWAGNGSNEVMLQLLQAYGGVADGIARVVVSATPTYSMYPEYARDTQCEYVTVPRRTDFSVDIAALLETVRDRQASVVILASPNNPTGTMLPQDDLRQLLAASTDSAPNGAATLVVVDEAYGEFRRTGVPSALELLADNPHLVVCRTMSKAFGMAGLRLGYAALHPEVRRDLERVRLPYHLSALTQAAALAALRHADEQLAQISQLRHRRNDLVVWLRAQGLTAVDSDANFVLFGVFADRRRIFSELLEHGVLIRQVGPAGYLRVSVGSETEDAAFRKALREVMEN